MNLQQQIGPGTGTQACPPHMAPRCSFLHGETPLLPQVFSGAPLVHGLGSCPCWLHLWICCTVAKSQLQNRLEQTPFPVRQPPLLPGGLSACRLPPPTAGAVAAWAGCHNSRRIFPSSWYQIFPCSLLTSFLAEFLRLRTASAFQPLSCEWCKVRIPSHAWGFFQELGVLGSACGEHRNVHPHPILRGPWVYHSPPIRPNSPGMGLPSQSPWSAEPPPVATEFPLSMPSLGAAGVGGAFPGGRRLALPWAALGCPGLGWAGLDWERPGHVHLGCCVLPGPAASPTAVRVTQGWG